MNRYTNPREGEIKLGERIQFGSISDFDESVEFVILGIKESVGPVGNLGFPGAENGYEAFMKAFCNIQSNQFLDGSEIGVIEPLEFLSATDVESSREKVELIDEAVEKAVSKILKSNKIPIVIGGGHNNAFPIIKALSLNEKGPVSVINLDPHADFRPLEGRHSGNPFSTAMDMGCLHSYFALGLHQSYNGKSIFDMIDAANATEYKVQVTYFDDWVYGNSSLEKDLEIALDFVGESVLATELDMDAIKMMPSSAMTPSGITMEQARFYISKMAKAGSNYLHLPEAAPKNTTEDKMVGKALAYLVSDFVKCWGK